MCLVSFPLEASPVHNKQLSGSLMLKLCSFHVHCLVTVIAIVVLTMYLAMQMYNACIYICTDGGHAWI